MSLKLLIIFLFHFPFIIQERCKFWEPIDTEHCREILLNRKTVFLPENEQLLPLYEQKRKRRKENECTNNNHTEIDDNDDDDDEDDEDDEEEKKSDAGTLTKCHITVLDHDKQNVIDEQEIFRHDGKTKEEIRWLQSKIMRKYMIPDVDPCNDFYNYACGNWKNYHKIPSDRSIYDTFEIIRENLDTVLYEIVNDDLAMVAVPPPPPQAYHINYTDFFQNNYIPNQLNNLNAIVKMKYFFQSCMNIKHITHIGNEPLLKLLDKLGGWPVLCNKWSTKRFNLFQLLGRLRLLNNDIIISQWIGPDMKYANQYIIHIDQSNLGLPSKEYFLDKNNIKYLRAYKILIIGTIKYLGSDIIDIEHEVDDIVNFEIKLAEHLCLSSENRRNISDVYLITDLASLTLYFPQYNWEIYFNIVLGTNIPLDTTVAVYCVKYLLDLIPLLSNTKHSILQNYIIWRFVKHRLNSLDNRFQQLIERFNRILYGKEKQSSRWKFCINQINNQMGMVLGGLFVRKYFDKKSKTDTIEMTKALMHSFDEILSENNWLDRNTKIYAKMKIENMDLKIGFPDFVLDDYELSKHYYDIEIHPDYFFENILQILRHLTRSERSKLDGIVNRTLWSTSPAVVNAYYSRNKNQIMFPAGILQPPFYHKYFPKALNFGGIGVVIGHEITHGFDDKGRLFDQFGNFMMWWHESSIENFYEKAQCLIDQYSQYSIPELKLNIDGYLTQGENIADNGGLKQSFRAYQKWLDNHLDVDETLPDINLTSKQLFFLNFAQIWCGQQRIQEAKNRVKTSVHSPGIFRIIGALSNSEDFAREYQCPYNSKMNPINKCDIW